MSSILKALQRLERDRAGAREHEPALSEDLSQELIGGVDPDALPPKRRSAALWIGLAVALTASGLGAWFAAPWFAGLVAEAPPVVAAAPRSDPDARTPAPVVKEAPSEPFDVASRTPPPPPGESPKLQARQAPAAEPAPPEPARPERRERPLVAKAEPIAPAREPEAPAKRAVPVPEAEPPAPPPEAKPAPRAEPAPKRAALPPRAEPAPKRAALPPRAEPAPKPPAAGVMERAPEISVLRTSWHPNSSRRVATVRVAGGSEPQELHEGDSTGALVVKKIEPSAVVFTFLGREVRRSVGR
jgi:hypothetical protein